MARLWGFALALAIAGAPLAPAICGVTCASSDMRSTSSGSEHHSCHESSMDGATAVPVPHTCGHDSDGSIAPQELIQILVAAGPTETSVSALASFDVPSGIVRSTSIEHGPPSLPTLTTPLRL
jgi:hypothetical protein